jgi:serine/threonine-protein kinase
MAVSISDREPIEELAESFLARYRAGERPSLSEYTAAHPELADRIRELFPALVEMEQAGSSVGPATGPVIARAGDSGSLLATLGDFRIVREVGRGGMGVVYEAVQESLGRHVALKVFAPWTRAEPKLIERFQREAKAAARLHHTNIVPVFGVGAHGGHRYYAMQFIQGQGLDAILMELRRLRSAPGPQGAGALPPDPTRSAPLAATVAHGLLTGRFGDLATQASSGTSSTDSPATGLAPADASRAPAPAAPSSDASHWASQPGASYARTIARVGLRVAEALAHAHGQGILHRDIKPSNLLLDIEGNVWVTDFGLAKSDDAEALTEAGDIVGTVRYMAPERFRGDSGAGSDVYGLGATIYELLTLRPAFDEGDRACLIDQILHSDPPPPRSVDAKIPRDLETIVLKAMARDTADRYATSGALAEDLRRFLDDRTILARRSSVAERLWRWCRREPAVASMTLALLAGLVGVATQWRRAELHLKDVVHERSRAEFHLAAARWQQGRAEDNERKQVEANHALQLANDRERTASRRAQERFVAAMTALRKVEDITQNEALLREPHLEGVRAELLRTALGFYSEFQTSLDEDGSPEARSQLGEAYARTAQLTWELGRQDEALAAHRRALAVVERINAATPDDPERRFALARCHTHIGFTLRTMGRTAEALQSYRQALAIQEPLARDHPGVAHYREVLAWTLSCLGVIEQDLGRAAEAIHLHRQAFEIHGGLFRQQPGNAQHRSDLGWCWRYLSQALASAGDLGAALRSAEQAVTLFEPLVGDDRRIVEFRWRLARSLDEIGRIGSLSGRPADAAEALERAAEIHETLARGNPGLYGVDVVRNRLYAACQRLAAGRPDDARACIRRAEDELRRSHQVRAGMLLHDLACSHILWSAAGREGAIGPAEREARTRRAIAVLRRAVMAGHADLMQVRRDPVLDPLRRRRDFEEMILDLSFPADPFRN